MKTDYDIIIIGGGPAGLAAAVSAYDSGDCDVLILEREDKLGGILNQCIHNGFGLTRFKESLSGPEYAARFIDAVNARNIGFLTQTTVLSVTEDKRVTAINPKLGIVEFHAKAIVLAMGCRERSRGALNVAGSRPAGVYSAGTAQKYVNIKGYLPGRKVVILGSGDIGLIMARRMTLEGAKVLGVFEIMPYSSGLRRNVVQCLDDFGIPLYLSHTIIKIEGEERVTGVVACKVDESRNPIPGTEMHVDCDTVLFSVGLIPEHELSKEAKVILSPKTRGAVVRQTRETSVDGIFACGNVLQVHDLVDFVSEEAEIAGRFSAKYATFGKTEHIDAEVKAGENVSYVLPQKIDKNVRENVKLFFRVTGVFKDCEIVITSRGKELLRRKKRIAVPGEMQTITLPEKFIDEAGDQITLSLEVEG
ncbi:MAG: FAD-dependent oxidoreductase [Clostridia bacterium]|nr:FAD-dependent oxidoreductase [Clostridia bacterium]